jgi:hypothetical protein
MLGSVTLQRWLCLRRVRMRVSASSFRPAVQSSIEAGPIRWLALGMQSRLCCHDTRAVEAIHRTRVPCRSAPSAHRTVRHHPCHDHHLTSISSSAAAAAAFHRSHAHNAQSEHSNSSQPRLFSVASFLWTLAHNGTMRVPCAHPLRRSCRAKPHDALREPATIRFARS